ncbi:hypothetical protein [Clavibacter sp. VKM Ac-2872]|uniref:hypothetical protein n=1 Tax=Clavibacter sp. VKM Ac-2872 TaxID=2783812 RepID=UPI00188CCF6F|nr:hypothetical protein [Clavibacter sp. VKM Ac-2872]MBF4625620.1 hypothetical protein [Clavibacter sp. VKM Ac-2872]
MNREGSQVGNERARNSDTWEPPGFGAALSGHLMFGVLKAPGVLLALWLLTTFCLDARVSFGDMVVGVAAATVAAALVEVLVEDRFSRVRRLSSPGGWDFALVPALAAMPMVVLLGWLLSGALIVGLALAAAWALVEAVEIAWLRPWEPGMTQAEHDAKWVELKKMTKDTFADDVEEIRRRAGERSMQRYREAIERKRREAGSDEGGSA